ncbi:hypothetical protein V0288_23895 [Pannus brasiliensis CCIBt3594]|uniref:Uncharacterized protein n=1 Tax=Pannus brasiliensis CCIBt3594 TaxID=1427578 RepID=A0AAW9R0T8_9CHRO
MAKRNPPTPYRSAGDRPREANILEEISAVQEDSGRSLEYFHRARTLYGVIGDKYSRNRDSLSIADYRRQNLPLSIDFYRFFRYTLADIELNIHELPFLSIL